MISFSLSYSDNKALSEFCREIFKVSLVNKLAEIIPIWPPVVKVDNRIELVNSKSNLFLLKSVQPNVKAFMHRMKYFKEINLEKVDKDKYLFKVSPSSSESAINIDDEYNSKYLIISNYRDEIRYFNNEIIVKDINENIIEKGRYNKLPSDRKLKIYSNSEAKVLHYRKGIILKSYKVKSKGIIIDDLKYDDKLVASIGLKRSIIIEFEKSKEQINERRKNDLEIYKSLKKLNSPLFEPIDEYVRSVTIDLKIYPKTFNLLRNYIAKNKMPIGTKKILKNINGK